MSTEKTTTKEHKDKVLKTLSKYSIINGYFGILAIIGFPTAFITWVWTDYIIFFKIIITSVILLLFTQFITKVIDVVKKGINNLEVKD